MSGDQLRDVHRGGVAHGEPRSLLARPLVWLIRCYQWTISPLLGPVCRYYPSCSAYGVTALERFGPFRGGWLTARRVLSCHPWSAGGVDHVPDRRDGAWHARPDRTEDHPGPVTTPVRGASAHRRD
ncbi:membrane protein insertion efficiency factor YidD [Serinicoccus kebangsaanensis]|uniref:membrane protein insertion efficiency factor YidD n=1 Tax=Serinicoccus kebangsaanensis TaxID=2602069 RepID=UPI00124D3DC7|nr:membrane protein insertion efficiency factor YidD [Serinicoccus kebangsaanensis]